MFDAMRLPLLFEMLLIRMRRVNPKWICLKLLVLGTVDPTYKDNFYFTRSKFLPLLVYDVFISQQKP